MPAKTLRQRALAAAIGASIASTVSAAAPQAVSAAHPDVQDIAAARANPSLLILQAGIFDPLRQTLDGSAIGAAKAHVDAPLYAIVQFQHDRLKQDREALRARGVEFLGYVPNDAYYVRLNGHSLADVQGNAGVRWAGAIDPAFKLDANLWRGARMNSVARQTDGSYEVILRAFNGVSSMTIANRLRAQVPTAQITMRSERVEAAPYVRAKVDAAALDALIEAATAIEGVYYVAPWIPTETTNSAGIAALQGNFTGNCAGSGPVCTGPTPTDLTHTPMWDHAITGSGQIIAVADSGTTPNAAWFTTLDKGAGPHEEITFSENPPPVPPALGTLHPDNKIIAYWTQPGGPIDYDFTSGHGTHTTGTVVGDAAGTFGATSYLPSTPYLANHELADGMAPNAQLLMQDAGPASATSIIIQDFEGTLKQAYDAGARVHSNSWGAKTAGQYSDNDENVDRVTFDNEGLLVVISAGNDVAGAMATGSPGNAKNALTVGALGHGGSLAKAGYSNNGPTADGRMKPDLAAPGSSVVSARNSTTVTGTITAPLTQSMSGTSMAAPTVSGNALLARQYFADGFYPRGYQYDGSPFDRLFFDGFDGEVPTGAPVDMYHPTGAVMKAVLLNATVPTTTPSAMPNTSTGWGRPWLDGNLWFHDTMPGGDDSRRLRVFERPNAAGLETGDVNEYAIDHVAPGVEFRATLTWFDAEAAAGSASTLVNNLDLEVVAPDNTVYLGNQFSGSVSVAGGSADAKDTVEQVRFTTPAEGRYVIRVKGTSVPGNGRAYTDRQGYGLAVSGSFGMPDPTPFPAPTALAVAANGTGGISISAMADDDAQSFQLYRADGTCASADAGDFHLVANGATLPLLDQRTQGGYSYAYKLRGVQGDVEGLASECIDVVSDAPCTLLPDFDRYSLTANAANASCSTTLAWAAAQSNCPAAAAIQYTVERATDPYFGTSTTLTSTAPGPAYTDSTVANGTPYYYRVSATDAAGNHSPLSLVVNATPSGVDGPNPGSYVDDVDTHSYMVMTPPWQVTNAFASNGTLSYHTGADGQPYPSNTCAAITTPAMKLTTGATLSFKARYNLEYQWDGVAMEISNDGGASWTDLPPDGGYPSSFAATMTPPVNACAYLASHGAFNGVSTAASNADPDNDHATPVFKPFTKDLSSYVGQTVLIRWRFSSDPASGYEGFSLDEVQINGAPGGGNYACTP